MKITALVENVSFGEKTNSEHGLSLYIEAFGKKILFDMGQTDLFLSNAQKLGVDLSAVDIAIVSHGHYDHGGGLSGFLGINKTAPIYISKYAFGQYYNETEKYIGLDMGLSDNDRLIFTDSEISICKGLTLYPAVSDFTGKFSSAGLNVFENGVFLPDDFCHEQYLVVEENGKKVLFSGCSHRGITNIMEKFRPDVFVGGFHFSKFLEDALCEYTSFLDGFDTVYYTCHCTGIEQYDFMKDKMRNLNYLSCGKTVVI